MPSQVLPPEIWLSIIQRLRGRNPSDWARRFFSVHPKITDVQTSERLVKANLRSLALVCHQLYHLVRPFVYEVIHLTWNSQEQLPVHAQREYNVILQDPAVATFIRTLILRGFPSSQNASWQGLVSRMEKLQSVVLWTAHCASFIHHIPHSVTELDVRYLNWNADQLMRPSVYRRIAIVPLGDNETPTLEAVTSSTVALYTSAMGMTNLKQQNPSLQSLEGLKDLRIHVNLHSVLSEGLLDAEPPLNVERLVLSASLVNSASPGPIGHLPQLRYIQAPLNMLHHFQGHKTIDELVLTHRYALPVDSLPSLDFPALQKFTFEARGLENPLYAASVCCCQADALRHLTLWSVDQIGILDDLRELQRFSHLEVLVYDLQNDDILRDLSQHESSMKDRLTIIRREGCYSLSLVGWGKQHAWQFCDQGWVNVRAEDQLEGGWWWDWDAWL